MPHPSFNLVANKILSFHNFILVSHKNPDGDAIASLTSLGMGLELMNKNVNIVTFDPIPETFGFLSGVEKIKNEIGELPEKCLVILLDCATIKRTGFEDNAALNNKIEIIAIDHHPKETGAIEGLICPKAAATAEIIFDLLEFLKIDIDHNIATSLLTGILTDTGGFKHSNTSPQTLRIAAKLLARGVSLTKITESVFGQKNLNILKIWGRALARIKIDPKIKMGTSIITNKDIEKENINPSEISGISSIMNTAREINFALLLTELNNTTKGSLRSEKEKGIDVAEIAKLFNGGGHKLAAGFEIKGNIKKNIADITEKISQKLKLH